MAVINVNGTSLQTAINAAQSGDTIVPSAGGYAGNLSITKPLTLELGSARIDGPQADGFKNINVTSKNVIIRDGILSHAGAAIQFNGDCTGSLVQRTQIPVVDFMVVNGAPANTGGMGVAFSKAVGVTLEDLQIHGCRAKSTQYGFDGADFEFFATRDITIRRCETWDGIYVSEWGRNPTDALNSGIVFEDCTFHGRANWQTGAVYSPQEAQTYRAGHLIRAADAITFRRNLFDHLDAWCFAFEQTGGYGGPITNVTIEENRARLSSKWISGSVTPAQVHSDRNQLWPIAGQLLVDVNGLKAASKPEIVARFPWESNSYIGPEDAAPPPPVPPVPPVDPCQVYKDQIAILTSAVAQAEAAEAEADRRLGIALAQVQQANKDRDEALTLLDQSRTEVRRLQDIVDAIPVPPVWTLLGSEGQTKSIPRELLVRYGDEASKRFNYRIMPTGSVAITNKTFFDPAVNVVKKAWTTAV